MRGPLTGLVMLVAFLVAQSLSIIGLPVLYAAGFYIAWNMRRDFDAPPVPDSAKESMTPGMLRLN